MKTILLVDDDDAFRSMLHVTLESVGYEVREASNGKKAVDLYRKQPADLVVTDIVMPEQEGIQTLLELRKINPEVRIIAMSGGGRIGPDDYLTAAKILGAKQTLSKPFRQADFLDVVARVLAGEP